MDSLACGQRGPHLLFFFLKFWIPRLSLPAFSLSHSFPSSRFFSVSPARERTRELADDFVVAVRFLHFSSVKLISLACSLVRIGLLYSFPLSFSLQREELVDDFVVALRFLHFSPVKLISLACRFRWRWRFLKSLACVCNFFGFWFIGCSFAVDFSVVSEVFELDLLHFVCSRLGFLVYGCVC